LRRNRRSPFALDEACATRKERVYLPCLLAAVPGKPEVSNIRASACFMVLFLNSIVE